MTGPAGPYLDHAAVTKLSETHGWSFFVLSGQRFTRNFNDLLGAFEKHYPDVRIGYSYKTNYTPQLCRIAHDLGGYAEVVSEMEYSLAKRLGIPGPRIIFNGPYKARHAFEDAALTGATLNIDSMRDIDMLRAVASAHQQTDINVVLRCNFELLEGGHISRFGMDPDGAEFSAALDQMTKMPNLRLKGLHCHFPNRDLDSFGLRAEEMVALMRRIFPDQPPEVLNIGGGYFSNMPDSLRQTFDVPPATFDDYAACIGGILGKAFAGTNHPTLFLEPGTAIAADTQSFYTRIVSVKDIRGKHFATVAGSAFDISPTARSRVLPVTPIMSAPRRDDTAHPFDVVGFTCIESDVLSEGVVAPLKPGDYLRYDNVGSYSTVMRPPFILPANPILFCASDEDELQLIKKRQTNEDVFADFVT